ncbi:MAG: hypothetical protein HF314_08405 [Ignavibacteria bacterium]|jgi:hypothetical protein|nr:hypothetical protein [Ignavibacteria bacterium]MCU7503080.1 hypothetical protein [Ignavibacteria bacterium]MCU7516500.1 hypothetical protein [Ignavibacteria bacterium]
MKKLFKNYTYEFDKNEKRLLINFCKQAIKQMESDNRFFPDVRAYSSIIDKLNEPAENVKLTKDELTRLTVQLKENIKFLKKKMETSWFLKKWLYKSLYQQYQNILATHFSD